MKVAVFYPESLYSAWSVSEGIVDTLKRMGHEPLNCGINPKAQTISRSQYPKFEELNDCDAVLVSGPEHLGKYLTELYPTFTKLKAKRLAWMHETVEREDYGRLPIESIKGAFDKVFTPAAQDEKYGMTFLPFGVDVSYNDIEGIFTEREWLEDRDDSVWFSPAKKYGAVFVGVLYGPRADFIKKNNLETLIKFGDCQVRDINGLNVRKSVELYASELRRSVALVNLPSLCRHAVTKITEGAACGAIVVTHAVEDDRNHILKSALLYRTGGELRSVIEELKTANRKELAKSQAKEVREFHRLDQRLAVILQ